MATITEDAAAMTLVCEGQWYMNMARTFHVSGLTSRTHTQVMEAVTAVQDAGYYPWAPYDTTHGLRVVNYQPRVHSISECTVLVTVQYVNGLVPIYHGGASLRTTQTDMDINGNPVTVYHAGTAANPVPEAERTQSGVLTIMVPDITHEIVRVQPSHYIAPGICDALNPPIKPWLLQRDYEGTLNYSLWNGLDPRTCLMESIDYDNQGLGTTAWNVRYVIRYNPDGWNPEVVWIDRNTGEPGVELVPDVGRKIVTAYAESDFNELNIELPL